MTIKYSFSVRCEVINYKTNKDKIVFTVKKGQKALWFITAPLKEEKTLSPKLWKIVYNAAVNDIKPHDLVRILNEWREKYDL